MNSKYLALAIAPALALTIAVGADARFGGGEGRMMRGAMHQKLDNVEHTVTNISNGIQISITSDDADTVTQIQERLANQPLREREDVTTTVANTSNGVLITKTSEDAETVERLQTMGAMAANGGLREHRKERRENFKAGLEAVERTIIKIDNGVEVTMTSEDADVVAKLQAHEPKESNEAVTVTKVNLSNGVKITRTSDDAQVVAQMHEHADNPGMGRERGKGMGQNVEKEVVNLDNGVQITITSEDADTVTKIQSKEPKNDKEGISVTKTNLSNGVQLTITSDDEATVERIQNHSVKRATGGFGRRGGHHDEAAE